MEFFTKRCGKALAQTAQRNCGYLIPGGIKDQFGWGPDLVGGHPAHGRELEIADL